MDEILLRFCLLAGLILLADAWPFFGDFYAGLRAYASFFAYHGSIYALFFVGMYSKSAPSAVSSATCAIICDGLMLYTPSIISSRECIC